MLMPPSDRPYYTYHTGIPYLPPPLSIQFNPINPITNMNIFKPSPSINYNFISSIYAAFALLGITLYSLETYVFAPHKDSDEHETMKELAGSTEGLYLIFIPFIPCFLWSLVVRKEYLRLLEVKPKED